MNVSIIGTGNMAKAIGTRLVSSGHSVTIHAKDSAKGSELVADLTTVATGDATVSVTATGGETDDVVILATPFSEAENIAAAYNGLAGKTVIDISNPIDFSTFKLIPPAGTAGAEVVAKYFPSAHVVKAFNTTFSGPLTAGSVDGKPLDVFIAADDEAAKATVIKLVETSGLRVIDAGPLAHARHLEGITLIHMSAQEKLGTGWMSALQIIT